MEALQRFEKWVLSIAGVLFLATVVYCFWQRGVEPPIKGLGEPTKILRKSDFTCFFYEVDQPLAKAFYDLDIRLQIKGYKGENRWGLSYRRGSTEYVTLDNGVWQTAPNGTLWLDWQQSGKTTVAYTIRTEGWWYPWKKAEQNWAYFRSTGAHVSVSGTSAPAVIPQAYRTSGRPIRIIR